MSSGYTAPISKRTYRWMPEQEAARALGISVPAMRKSIIRGSHKARVTSAGIAQVLVCLNPWVAAGEDGKNVTVESTESPVESSVPSVGLRPCTYALAGMHGRERITWIVVVLAFLLLVSLTLHAAKTQAGMNRARGSRENTSEGLSYQGDRPLQILADSRRNVDAAVSAIANDFADARRRRRTRHSTTAPTTQELFAMDDALPSDLQIGEFFPRFDPEKRTMMRSERQTEETLGVVPATPSDDAPKTRSGYFSKAIPSAGQSHWDLLQTSRFVVGSDPDGWSVILSEPHTNTVPAYRVASFIPAVPLGGASSSGIATSFHLSSDVPNNSGSVGAGNPGTTGGVGVEPPQLGDGLSPTPEPGGLVLFGLAASPILLKRRRNIPLAQT